MPIWEYSDRAIDKELILTGLSSNCCLFCSELLISLAHRTRSHGRRRARYVHERAEIHTCPTCGWWTVEEVQYTRNPRGGCSVNPRTGRRGYGALGSLRTLDLRDLSTPLAEVRKFLTARYELRQTLNPRLLEETVASVFADLGYQPTITSYSGDGGIDVVLDGPDDVRVGVQVKRYTNSIEVEQIRSFTGALLIGGYTKGIFVTTSRFQSGAAHLTALAALRGIEIELMDAKRFYDALKIAQRASYQHREDLLNLVDTEPLTLLKQHAKW